MKTSGYLFKLLTGRGRLRPQLIFMGALVFFAIFIFFVLLSYHEASREQKASARFITQKPVRPKKLDYKIIKLDTIPF
ncbi:MAG: hypothetical protein D6814_14690, partial [Calditrichaeota bacterium]